MSQNNQQKLSFQADADFNQKIVKAILRKEPCVDFQNALDAKLESLSDLEVLFLAANQKRLLVSHENNIATTFC